MRTRCRRLISSSLQVAAASFTISGPLTSEDLDAWNNVEKRGYRRGYLHSIIARVGVAASAWSITAITVNVFDLYGLALDGAVDEHKLYTSGSYASPTPSDTVAFLRANALRIPYSNAPAIHVTGTASNAGGTNPVPVHFALLIEDVDDEEG
ncbi:MAG TPA: hypothetical protein VFV33_01615 [Gemmatimonadaceae bacterium]|nr:hypothetical protein [Gemmatimonadaceae bacterium]